MDLKHETRVVPRPFGDVTRDLHTKSNACLERTITHPGTRDTAPLMEAYRYELETVAEGRAAWSVKISYGSGDFIYGMAANIGQQEAAQTRVELYYGVTKFGEIAEAFWEWAEGRDAACPDLD